MTELSSHISLDTNWIYFCLVLGENLVSEQEDEVETGGAGLSRPPSFTGDVSAVTPGSIPQHGRSANPLPGECPGLLPATRAADGASAADARSSRSSSYDAKPTLLLKKLQKRLLRLKHLNFEKVQSIVVLYDV